MKYIHSTSQMSKLSLTFCTFSITGSVASLFLTTLVDVTNLNLNEVKNPFTIAYTLTLLRKNYRLLVVNGLL